VNGGDDDDDDNNNNNNNNIDNNNNINLFNFSHVSIYVLIQQPSDQSQRKP
jgi:hypothetical protein